MECPECKSNHINKNGRRKGKQNHICVDCGRQFIDSYESSRGYAQEIKQECLKMYVNGMGFRAIERVTGVHNTTVMDWVKKVGVLLPDYYKPEAIPLVGELDELETFVGSKKNKIWLWTVVDHFQSGILGWVLGDHSSQTFRPLWDEVVSQWKCYFYVTDSEAVAMQGASGWKVYPMFIPDSAALASLRASGDQIVSKIYMTRVVRAASPLGRRRKYSP